MRSCPRCCSLYSTHLERCGIDGEQLVDSETDPLIGKTIERYQIDERIGAGAMGVVYRARHTTLDRQHAVKVLFGEMASNREVVERFRREAKSLSRIDHPNIVSVIDFGATKDGLLFLVMELVRGVVLSSIMSESRARGVACTPAQAARIIRQIASGLAQAHKNGFVHRDLKPANIMIVPQGGVELVKILDFGIVGIVSVETDATSPSPLTKAGYILGTPTYMAPEQIGHPTVGPSADLYALGVILYEMLAGRPPFQGALDEVLVAKLSRAPDSLPPSDGLERLAMRLLEREPSGRPNSAEEVIGDLDQWEAGFAPTKLRSASGPPPALAQSGAAVDPAPTMVRSPADAIPSTFIMSHSGSPLLRRRRMLVIAITIAVALWISLWAAGRNRSAVPEPFRADAGAQMQVETVAGVGASKDAHKARPVASENAKEPASASPSASAKPEPSSRDSEREQRKDALIPPSGTKPNPVPKKGKKQKKAIERLRSHDSFESVREQDPFLRGTP